MSTEYKQLPKNWKYWCNTHQRRATYAVYLEGFIGKVCCNPELDGIMIGCTVTDISDLQVSPDTKDEFFRLVTGETEQNK